MKSALETEEQAWEEFCREIVQIQPMTGPVGQLFCMSVWPLVKPIDYLAITKSVIEG